VREDTSLVGVQCTHDGVTEVKFSVEIEPMAAEGLEFWLKMFDFLLWVMECLEKNLSSEEELCIDN
jgi:hypothetical protein